MGFLDTILGNTAAAASNAAAQDTYKKQQAAITGIQQAGSQYNTGIQGLAPAYNPYTQGGNAALQQLLGGLGLGGPDAAARFTDAYQALPGYQEGRDQGLRATMYGRSARD